MKVTNESPAAADKVDRIVRFLRARFPKAKSTAIWLVGYQDPEAPRAVWMTGDAFPSGGWARRLSDRHMVRCYIPTLLRPYPTTQQNPAGQGGCPRVTFNNWEEELVTVLAHELQHVTQFEEAGCPADLAVIVEDADDRYEVDAEKRAASMLAAWQVARAKDQPNQCDGCCAGKPLRGDCHDMGKPGGYRDTMTCERSKYETA